MLYFEQLYAIKMLYVEGKLMKRKIISIIFLICIVFSMTSCQKNELVENTEVKDEQEIVATCEIRESSDPTCEKPVKTGIYTEYSQWEEAIDGTDVEVILEMADMYDEEYFADQALIYLVDCSSGGAQLKYEGYEIKEAVLYIQVSGSTEFLLNKLHAYHVFFTMDKEDAEKLDKAELSISSRD